MPMLKFPGGGLEWGEGIADALKREFKEELNAEIEIVRHFYTTDFFQASAFNPQQQIISVYYLVRLTNNNETLFTEWDKSFPSEGEVRFHWISPSIFESEAPLTFPIDRKVGLMIKNEWALG